MEDRYAKDLESIRDMMNRSTRFISLSGWSGVSTGVIALVGAFVGYRVVFQDSGYLVYEAVGLTAGLLRDLLLIVMGTLVVSVISAVFFTRKQAIKRQFPAWDTQAKRLLINLLIPLVAGGLFALMLLLKGFVGMLPSVTLLFYGLALVNASKYSLSGLRSLGLIEVILGLLAFLFIGYGLLIWAVGFGLVQIGYGFWMQKREAL